MICAAVSPMTGSKTDFTKMNHADPSKEELRKLRHRFAQQRYKQKLKKAQRELEVRAESATSELKRAHEELHRKDNLIREMKTIIAVQGEEIQHLKSIQLQQVQQHLQLQARNQPGMHHQLSNTLPTGLSPVSPLPKLSKFPNFPNVNMNHMNNMKVGKMSNVSAVPSFPPLPNIPNLSRRLSGISSEAERNQIVQPMPERNRNNLVKRKHHQLRKHVSAASNGTTTTVDTEISAHVSSKRQNCSKFLKPKVYENPVKMIGLENEILIKAEPRETILRARNDPRKNSLLGAFINPDTCDVPSEEKADLNRFFAFDLYDLT